MAYELEEYQDEVHSIPFGKGRFVVAIYETDRRYGGPEEGGWWYDAGTLHGLVSVHKNKMGALKKVARGNHLFQFLVHKNKSFRNRYSMAYSGGDFEFRIYEGLPPAYFPEVRPHYE